MHGMANPHTFVILTHNISDSLRSIVCSGAIRTHWRNVRYRRICIHHVTGRNHWRHSRRHIRLLQSLLVSFHVTIQIALVTITAIALVAAVRFDAGMSALMIDLELFADEGLVAKVALEWFYTCMLAFVFQL